LRYKNRAKVKVLQKTEKIVEASQKLQL